MAGLNQSEVSLLFKRAREIEESKSLKRVNEELRKLLEVKNDK